MILVSLIMVCSMIGTVILIGVCSPLSSSMIPTSPHTFTHPTTVIEEPFKEDRNLFADDEDGRPSEKEEEENLRGNLREWIASSSIPTLRSRGMKDEEIKTELLRDFNLTEEEVERILATQ